MTDSIFQPGDQTNAMILSRIKRSDGSIPYARRANQVYSTSKVKAPLSSGVNPSNSGLYQAGTVSPTGGLQNVGNTFPMYIQGNFAFVASPTGLTIYWDGTNGSQIFVIKRVDGTSYTVPKGSLAINGLSPATLYGFLPFNCLTRPETLSFCTGDAGDPRYAFSPSCPQSIISAANQTSNLANNEAITQSFIYYMTPASGTSSGDGLPGVNSPYSQRRDAP